jgi:hypothetical protein
MLGDTVLDARISPEPNSGCWLWVGYLNDSGYGLVSVGGKERRAHRVVYERVRGPIPDGLQLDHLCRTRCCVNPAQPVTNKENCRRSPLLGRWRSDGSCLRGHIRTPENTRQLSNGYRACRDCARITRSARAAAKKKTGRHMEKGRGR